MVFDLARFEPFSELAELQQRMNRILQEFGERSGRQPAVARAWAPVVDVVETPDAFVFAVELPGLNREDIDIEMTNDGLTIRGERKFTELPEGERYLRQERAYGPFQRTFNVSTPIAHDKIKATYKDGILEVTLPKSEQVKPKKIEVAAE